MYFINTGQMLDNLLTFDKLKFDNVLIHGYVHAMVDDVIRVFNSKDFDQAYDRIGHMTTLLGNNTAVEDVYMELLTDLRKYAKKSGWDDRIHVKIHDKMSMKDNQGRIMSVLVVMDLDATFEAMEKAPDTTISLGELVSDNPSQDDISKIIQN